MADDFDKDLFNAEQYPADFGESAQAEPEAQSKSEPSPIMPVSYDIHNHLLKYASLFRYSSCTL